MKSPTNFGALKAQDAGSPVCPKPENLQVALRGHPSFRGGSAEWHVMDAALRLARNHRLPMLWERQVRIRLFEPSLHQRARPRELLKGLWEGWGGGISVGAPLRRA